MRKKIEKTDEAILLSQNMHKLMNFLKFTYRYDFADTIGVNRSLLHYVMSAERLPNAQFLYSIKSAYPWININWLLFSQGEMILPGYELKGGNRGGKTATKQRKAIAIGVTK